MVKGSDLLVGALEQEGVDLIFGVRGEKNLDVVESLRHSKSSSFLQVTSKVLLSWLRLTAGYGKPGVRMTTLADPDFWQVEEHLTFDLNQRPQGVMIDLSLRMEERALVWLGQPPVRNFALADFPIE